MNVLKSSQLNFWYKYLALEINHNVYYNSPVNQSSQCLILAEAKLEMG